MKLVASTHFDKNLNKLLKSNPQLKSKIGKTLRYMQLDLTYPSLRLHKLSGNNLWSVSVDLSIRILFSQKGNTLFLLDIGKHKEVY